MKINKELFDLATIYDNLSQAQIWSMSNNLTSVKYNLEELLFDIADHQLFEKQYKEQKEAIENQLFFVNANIKTLEDALLCHESKFIEKRTNLGDLGMFCLN